MSATDSQSGGLPTHYRLPRGNPIPSIGLGTWKAPPEELQAAVKVAIDAGYRHIDTAAEYENEHVVGEAIKQSGIKREDIWITTKLWNAFHAPEDVEPALNNSLKELGTDYVDLWLMHWPVAFTKDRSAPYDKNLTANQYPTWKKMEEMLDKGKVRNIGVSNFTIERMETLLSNDLKYKPIVNQVELSFFNPQPELLSWSQENGVLLEAYSPFGSEERSDNALERPWLKEIAESTGLTPSQVYISWHIQRGVVALPKSITPERIKENIKIKRIPEEVFRRLEKAATSHPPERAVNPSKSWGLDFDVFEDPFPRPG